MIEITFVRHGESVANASGRWQGQSDSPLTEEGRAQAAALGRRWRHRSFDVVITSDLTRTRQTAEHLADDAEPDPAWRELDVGRWEGLTREEVAERFGDEMDALRRGEDVRIGGGESWSDVDARAARALDALLARLSDGQRALVVSHGGILSTLVAARMSIGHLRPRPLGRIVNTGVTTLRFDGGVVTLGRYNDGSHVSPRGDWVPERLEAGDAVLVLVASDAREVGPIDRLAAAYPALPVYTLGDGPGARTARALADALGSPFSPVPSPSLAAAVTALGARHPGEAVALAAPRQDVAALVSALCGHGPATPARIEAPRPAALSHLLVHRGARVVVDYDVGSHLPG